MKSIRQFVYATLLTLSVFNFAPSLASAQDAAGTFTFAHDVHWQNAIVPPGKYRFTVAGSGPSELLVLRNTSGSGTSFRLVVNDVAESQPADLSQIIVVSRTGGRFVSTMKLPDLGLTLHFAVPAETREVAQTVATSTGSAVR